MTRLPIYAATLAIAALAATAGYWAGMKRAPQATEPTPPTPVSAQVDARQERRILYWYDPMMPQQHFDRPGKSPFMDMQLVPKYADEAGDAGGVTIDPRIVQNMGMRVAPVEQAAFARRIDTVGTVRADEHRIEAVQSRAMGWIERLHVRAVNDPVRRGEVLAEIYAPDLLAAQQEYLLALKSMVDADGRRLAEAARARLSLLGLTDGQIAGLEKSGKPARRIALYSPINGIVAELGTREGMAVNPGMTMFSLVDLSTVWVTAEIVENQAAWVTPGKPAEARVAALPGKVFKGRVDYVYPELTPQTRTLKARIVLRNPGLELKPGMFADVTLLADTQPDMLQVPSAAVIKTGTRSVVILAEGGGKFRPVDVVTGAEAGGKTEILKGLTRGQQVVVSGQFLIDSEANLTAALTRLGPPADTKESAEMNGKPGPGAAAGSTTVHHGEGKVTAVDAAAGRITLQHGPIPGLNWPAMTMEFAVRDTGVLSAMKTGQRVGFDFVEQPAGQYTVTRIVPLK